MIENIMVKPKRFKANGEKLLLGKILEPNFRIVIASELGMLGEMARTRLINKLSEYFIANAEEADGEISIVLKISDIVPDEAIRNIEQGYKLFVDNSSVRIIGFTDLGLYYGVTTFLQALDVVHDRVEIQKLMMLDYPDFRTRGCLIDSSPNNDLATTEDFKIFIDRMVEKKLNQLVIPLHIFKCTECDKPDISTKSTFSKISLKQNSIIKRYHSSETNSWINEVIPRQDIDCSIDEIIKYGRSHGIEVLPLINFDPNIIFGEIFNLDDNGFSVLSKKSQDLFFSVYDFIIEKYLKTNSIESLHIGLDHLTLTGGTKINSVNLEFPSPCKSPEETIDQIENKMLYLTVDTIRHLKVRGIRNVYLYSDIIQTTKSINKLRDLLESENLTDVTCFDFLITPDSTSAISFYNLASDFEFRSVVKHKFKSSNLIGFKDCVADMYQITNIAFQKGSEGIQSYSGLSFYSDINYSALANYSWNIRGSGTVEDFKKYYVKSEFTPYSSDALKGLEILNELSKESFENNNFTVSNASLYGEFSDLFSVKFPDEFIAKLLCSEDEYADLFNKTIELSSFGCDIFKKINLNLNLYSHPSLCYLLELRNCKELALSFKAFMEIQLLLKSPKLNKSVINKIINICDERKDAMIELIGSFEGNTECHHMYDRLRKYSVIMQLFREIKNHLETAQGKKLRIDLTNFSSISSALFKFLL